MLGFNIWKVQGASMTPIIPSESFVLVTKWLGVFPIEKGQRLVIDHPEFGIIIKTVAVIDKCGFIWSRGENKKSIAVEKIGPVEKRQIIGRVISVFKPEGRCS
jgi:nickel-type superoxide dismutase maturation protease